MNDITYMQDMTAAICNATPAPSADDIKNMSQTQVLAATPSKQLLDKRDNKYYWVAKLADGNCWMTQNLDFDVPSTLSNTTSDISSSSVATNISAPTAISAWTNDNNTPRYNDPGDYYYKGPNGDHSQDTGNSCTSITDGLSNAKCSLFAKTDPNTKALGNENAHYHVGNYYNWLGATVSSGKDLTNRGDQAPDSICPRNWQLPTSGTNASNALLTNGKTFAKLFEAYGWKWNQTTSSSNLHGGTLYYIYSAPFYFTYGGYLDSSTLYYAGYYGFYWSSTVGSSPNVFNLRFASNVDPANIYTRYYGFSVRCVAE